MHKIIIEGSSFAISGELPSIGSRAPDFSLVNTDLHDVSLANYMGKRKVLNIFPSIDTPVCAKSVRAFDALAGETQDVAMLMISYDLPFAHARFLRQYELQHVDQGGSERRQPLGAGQRNRFRHHFPKENDSEKNTRATCGGQNGMRGSQVSQHHEGNGKNC